MTAVRTSDARIPAAPPPERAGRRGPLKSGIRRSAGGPARAGDEALLSAALRYLSQRDRTQAQVAAYLARRGASPARSRAVLSRLRAWGYLDDEAFALRWAQARVARRPMGRARLEAELLARGFDAETTAKTLRTIYADRTEAQLAEVLLAKASRQAPRSSARAAALLRRFGFEEESIESALGMDASL